MARTTTQPPTSVRLDDFQLLGLARLQQRQDRSRSWLIARAVDDMLERELGMDRAEHEAKARAAADAALLASFTPRPFRMSEEGQHQLSELVDATLAPELGEDPDEVLTSRIEALLEEHAEEIPNVATWSKAKGVKGSSRRSSSTD